MMMIMMTLPVKSGYEVILPVHRKNDSDNKKMRGVGGAQPAPKIFCVIIIIVICY